MTWPQPAAHRFAALIRASRRGRDARMTRARPQDCLEAVGEEVAEMAEESRSNDNPGHRPRG